jgi:hypothetical protein
MRGEASPPAMQKAHALLRECLKRASLVTVKGAAHFMPATHAAVVSAEIARHVHAAEGGIVIGPEQVSPLHCQGDRPREAGVGEHA